MTPSRDLVRAVAPLAEQPLPAEVARAATLRLRDAVGVGLAAAGSPIGAPYRQIAKASSAGKATLFGTVERAKPEVAALLNGGLIHSLEYDDTHTRSIVHGSSLAAAVSLAVAQECDVGGAALLGAFARAWEVLIRIGLAAPGGFQTRGFHITSVAGTLTAALTAASLMRLTEDQQVAAIGISLSQASGVFEFLSNGSSVKSLHPGWAAHSGIYAATFAAAGMTGPETAFEGHYGLFRHFAASTDGAERFCASLGDLGKVWHLPDAAFKLSPCCHFLHPFIEAAVALRRRGIVPEAVERITFHVPPGAAPIICEPWDTKLAPRDGHAIRWSLPVAVAIQLVEGAVGLEAFERPASEPVLALARRMVWAPMETDRFPERFEAELVCETTAGHVETVRVEDAYGNRSRPAGMAELDAKFRTNAARTLTPDGVRNLEAAFDGLIEASDLHALAAAMQQLRSSGDEA